MMMRLLGILMFVILFDTIYPSVSNINILSIEIPLIVFKQ